jgi:diguanylate cyclase (GGDEF)-like protein
MPQYPNREPTETIHGALREALDLVDFGIALFDRDLRTRFINRWMTDFWHIPPALLATAPTIRQLMDNAAAAGLYLLTSADLPAYFDGREAEIRAGSTPPAVIELADHRRIVFRCFACADGGRLLTYSDISDELRRESSLAVARISADLRFNSEVLEEQGARLATLAEAAEENARRAEADRQLLEREVAERRQLEAKLRHTAMVDGLTGALNRAAFLASAKNTFETTSDPERNLVVLMIDVDHFKAINDGFGHAGGDRALVHLVATLRAGIRQIDLLGRLGGEEFGIVLIDTPPGPAARVAERLRARVAEAPVISGDRLIPMTISVGLAIRSSMDSSIEQIIARADDALYRAKGSGRNQVVMDERPEAA